MSLLNSDAPASRTEEAMSTEFIPNAGRHTVDEILSHPVECSGLPDGAIPVHVVLLIEYAEPGSATRPSANRLATITDWDMTPWGSIGMMKFAMQMEIDAVGRGGSGDDE